MARNCVVAKRISTGMEYDIYTNIRDCFRLKFCITFITLLNTVLIYTMSGISRDIDYMINTLKSKCPKSNIWLCKIPRRTHLSWLHSEIAKVNTFLQKSSHGKNVRFIDSCPEFGPRYFRRDMTHFTPHGVHVYGDKIACSMINFYINQTNRYR